jgi:soluble lytic murein transglycosylase-like protein
MMTEAETRGNMALNADAATVMRLAMHLAARLAAVPFFLSSAWATPVEQSSDEHRMFHARELLGKHYNQSSVRFGEGVEDISGFVREAISRRMKTEKPAIVDQITRTILEEARVHELDPLLIVAIIERESGFRPRIRGGLGEVGLMQILPSTGRWIAKQRQIPWKGVLTLLDPAMNIKLGTLYIASLREKLAADGRLYIAAYNMGLGNVQNLLKRNRRPRVYPERIMKSYVKLYAELKRDLDAAAAAP